MRVLLTNDDGIRAPGIIALHQAITGRCGRYSGGLGSGKGRVGSHAAPLEVLTVAPLTVQSATSHGVTFHEPLMVREEPMRNHPDARGEFTTGVAVDGRPADCVKLAISSIWPERMGEGTRPDLLISGMNAGANCGINVIYSGTVAAALEGAFLGIPSIAVSLMLGSGKPRWDVAAARARHALEVILAGHPGGLRPYEVVSVNIPVTEDPSLTPESPMPNVQVAPMNVHGLVDKYERRVSPSGDVYFWAAGHGLDFHGTDPGSDVDLLMRGCITVTPLKFDLTKHESVKTWRERVEQGEMSV